MTLTEKFAGLTPAQRERFNTIKDTAELDIFLAETAITLTAEEKEQTASYIASGRMPLADEELESVAGGLCGNKPGTPPPLSEDEVNSWKIAARADGRERIYKLPCLNNSCRSNLYSDPSGFENYKSVYAKSMTQHDMPKMTTSDGVIMGYKKYCDCKCYCCGQHWSELIERL